jgi:hypothetical protein
MVVSLQKKPWKWGATKLLSLRRVWMLTAGGRGDVVGPPETHCLQASDLEASTPGSV